MITFKSLALVASLGLVSMAASAAPANITLTGDGLGLSAEFSAYGVSNAFTFDSSSYGLLNNFVSSLDAKVVGKGYDIISATFDGIAYNADVNSGQGSLLSKDSWSFSMASLAAGEHTIVVNGVAQGGSVTGFQGSVLMTASPVTLPTVTAAVPEPESYAMLLAGLGLMGTMARRRRKPSHAA